MERPPRGNKARLSVRAGTDPALVAYREREAVSNETRPAPELDALRSPHERQPPPVRSTGAAQVDGARLKLEVSHQGPAAPHYRTTARWNVV